MRTLIDMFCDEHYTDIVGESSEAITKLCEEAARRAIDKAHPQPTDAIVERIVKAVMGSDECAALGAK